MELDELTDDDADGVGGAAVVDDLRKVDGGLTPDDDRLFPRWLVDCTLRPFKASPCSGSSFSSIKGMKDDDVSREAWADVEEAAAEEEKGDGRLGRNSLLDVPLGMTDLLEDNCCDPCVGLVEEAGAYLVESLLEEVDAEVGVL